MRHVDMSSEPFTVSVADDRPSPFLGGDIGVGGLRGPSADPPSALPPRKLPRRPPDLSSRLAAVLQNINPPRLAPFPGQPLPFSPKPGLPSPATPAAPTSPAAPAATASTTAAQSADNRAASRASLPVPHVAAFGPERPLRVDVSGMLPQSVCGAREGMLKQQLMALAEAMAVGDSVRWWDCMRHVVLSKRPDVATLANHPFPSTKPLPHQVRWRHFKHQVRWRQFMRQVRREAAAGGDTLQRIAFHALEALQARMDGTALTRWQAPLKVTLQVHPFRTPHLPLSPSSPPHHLPLSPSSPPPHLPHSPSPPSPTCHAMWPMHATCPLHVMCPMHADLMAAMGHGSEHGMPTFMHLANIAAVHEIPASFPASAPASAGHSVRRRRLHIIAMGFYGGPHWVNIFLRLAAHFPPTPPSRAAATNGDAPVASSNSSTSSGNRSGSSASTHPTTPPTPLLHATPPPRLMAHVKITAVDFGIVKVEENPTGLVHLGGRYLEQVASMLGLSMSFHGIGTNLHDFHPSQVEVDEGEEVVVLANWGLMVFPDDTVLRSNPRNTILKWIRDLRPLLLLQVDIDLDANGPFFLSRFHAAFANFAACVESFDASMPHSTTSRFIVESILARDFINGVACEGMNRWLRSERLEKWVHRMRAVGLEPVPIGPDTVAAGREATEGRDKRFRLEVHGDCKSAVWTHIGMRIDVPKPRSSPAQRPSPSFGGDIGVGGLRGPSAVPPSAPPRCKLPRRHPDLSSRLAAVLQNINPPRPAPSPWRTPSSLPNPGLHSAATPAGMLPRPMCGAKEGMLKQQLLALAEAMAVDDSVRWRQFMRQVRREAAAGGDTLQRIAFHSLEALEARMDGTALTRWRSPLNITLQDSVAVLGHGGEHGVPAFMHLANIAAVHEIVRAFTHQSCAHTHPNSPHPHTPPLPLAASFPASASVGHSVRRRRLHIIAIGLYAGPHWIEIFMRLAAHFSSTGGAVDFGFVSLEEYPTGLVHLGGQYLEQVASMLGLSLSFQGMETTPHDFHPSQVEVDEGEEVIVLANWGLMVFPDDTVLRSNPRNAILKWIRDLRPLLLLQVDADLDANGPFFLARFHAAFANFAALIESFDASMPHAATQRFVAESILARDFINEVACEGMNRWLRAERLEMWVHRMKAVGLEPVPLGPDTVVAGREATEGRDKRFRLEVHGVGGLRGPSAEPPSAPPPCKLPRRPPDLSSRLAAVLQNINPPHSAPSPWQPVPHSTEPGLPSPATPAAPAVTASTTAARPFPMPGSSSAVAAPATAPSTTTAAAATAAAVAAAAVAVAVASAVSCIKAPESSLVVGGSRGDASGFMGSTLPSSAARTSNAGAYRCAQGVRLASFSSNNALRRIRLSEARINPRSLAPGSAAQSVASRASLPVPHVAPFGPERPLRVDVSGMLPRPMCGAREGMLKQQLMALAEAMAVGDSVRWRQFMRQVRREAAAGGDTLQRIAFHAVEALQARMDGTALTRWCTPLNITLQPASFPASASASTFASQSVRRRRLHIIAIGLYCGPHWIQIFMRLAAHFSSPPLLPAAATTANGHPPSGIPGGGPGAVPNAAGGGVSGVQGRTGAFGAGIPGGGAAADAPVTGSKSFTSSGSTSGSSGSTHPTTLPTPPPPRSTAHVKITAVDFGIIKVEEHPTGLVHLGGQYLEKVASMLGLSLSFHGIETNPLDFHPSQVEVDEGEEVVVLANWGLMVFPDDSVLRSNPRNAILKWIRDLRPLLLLQVDIDLDANGPFFLSRFHAAFANFAAFIESFDASMPHSASSRFAAETILARDLMNGVACEGMNRWLRSERLEKWVHRMRTVGLEPVPLGPDTVAAGREITEGRDKRFRLEVHGETGALQLSWRGVPMIFVAAWR
ncbi:unnamed protein product [Closterium sp. NIES-65]|nr:unnamed protein product [Closterium sp. NIES-65]